MGSMTCQMSVEILPEWFLLREPYFMGLFVLDASRPASLLGMRLGIRHLSLVFG